MALEPTSTLAARAGAAVREHTLLAAAAALIPEPVLCTTGVAAVHLRMLTELSEIYAVPFSPPAGRVLLAAASAGLLTDCVLARPLVRRAIGALGPLILPVWFVGGAVLAGGFTHFLGQAVTRHYERGGTLADFDWPGFRREFGGKLKARLPGVSIKAGA